MRPRSGSRKGGTAERAKTAQQEREPVESMPAIQGLAEPFPLLKYFLAETPVCRIW